jgi:AcrR family transcriptional regulator
MASRGTATATQAAIWAAAHRLFATQGFAGTSVRDIAREAGVDPALVIRHFTSKELLFLDTMQVDFEYDRMFAGPIERLGEQLVDFVLTAEEQVRNVFLELLRAGGRDKVGSRLRGTHELGFVQPLLERLTGPDAELRARLGASLIGGLLYSLWVVGDEQLAATDHRELVVRYGALLQSLITPKA